MADPIRQHTVPASYLRLFSDDPSKWRDSKVYIYDVQQKKWWYSAVKNLTVENDFYTLEAKDWTKSYEVEKFLAEHIDNVPSLIEKIDNKENLTQAELVQLSYFIVAQELRTQFRRKQHNEDLAQIFNMELPMIFHHLQDKNERLQSIKNTLQYNHNIQIDDKEAERIYGDFEAGKKVVIDDKKWSIESMLRMIPALQKYVYGRAWVIVQTTDDINMSFVTSDFPLFFSGWAKKWIEGMYTGWFMTTPEMHIPLSKKSYLTMYAPHLLEENGIDPNNAINTKNIYRDCDDQWIIDMLNHQTAFGTQRQFIWNSEKVVLRTAKIVEDSDEKYKKKHWIK